jgi:kynureninase
VPATTTTSGTPPRYEDAESFALRADEADPLRDLRARFCLPAGPDGEPVIYFCGNSLGLQPRGVRDAVQQELEDWAHLAVDAHFKGRHPWYAYHEQFRASFARLVGARPAEVVVMNSLTVNLHLMMVSFFRPTAERYRILMEWPAFPSDIYAIKSQLRLHGLDPDDALLIVRPREGEELLRTEDVASALERDGDSVALVLMSGVNYFTGQLIDMATITDLGHRAGCVVGFDLAHAAGNVPLSLHDWNVDFACWCTYKYLNAGPGAVAGCFVHERHARCDDLPRLAGWWGNDPATRFRMHLEETFVPEAGADGWQISNPPIMAMAPLRASLALFDEAGMDALRAKSLRLTGYLRWLLQQHGGDRYEIITPSDDAAHGCQLSVRVKTDARRAFAAIESAGVVGDFREPDVVRLSPVPLYNTFHEVWRCAHALANVLD